MDPVHRHTHAHALLDVTQRGDASQDPVIRILRSAHDDDGDVGEIRAARLLVDGAVVEARVLALSLDGVHVHDGQQHIENFRVWLN